MPLFNATRSVTIKLRILSLWPVLLCLLHIGVAHAEPANLDILAAQLAGENCAYDAACQAHWSWWQTWTTRHPGYRCKMVAARCLARQGDPAKQALPALRRARDAMPASYDTGDGIIRYRDCLDAVIQSLAGATDTAVPDLQACSS